MPLKDRDQKMKKFALALTITAAFTGSALAADMAPRAYSKAPAPMAAVASWTGFWISGGFGYGLAAVERSVTGPVTPFPVFDTGQNSSARGWLGKVGAGFDYQASQFVIGAFADGQWSDIKGNHSFGCPGGCFGPFLFRNSVKNDWSWAAGARIGYIALPSLLTYVNAGYAQANFTGTNYVDGFNGSATGLTFGDRRYSGYFVGGGTEYAVTQIPGLFWKSEYRFADYGERNFSQVCTVTGPCGAAGSTHSIDHSRAIVQTATTELVYRFNWGGPAVAKY